MSTFRLCVQLPGGRQAENEFDASVTVAEVKRKVLADDEMLRQQAPPAQWRLRLLEGKILEFEGATLLKSSQEVLSAVQSTGRATLGLVPYRAAGAGVRGGLRGRGARGRGVRGGAVRGAGQNGGGGGPFRRGGRPLPAQRGGGGARGRGTPASAPSTPTHQQAPPSNGVDTASPVHPSIEAKLRRRDLGDSKAMGLDFDDLEDCLAEEDDTVNKRATVLVSPRPARPPQPANNQYGSVPVPAAAFQAASNGRGGGGSGVGGATVASPLPNIQSNPTSMPSPMPSRPAPTPQRTASPMVNQSPQRAPAVHVQRPESPAASGVTTRTAPIGSRRGRVTQGELSAGVRATLLKVVQWAKKRKMVRVERRNISARKSRLLHQASPTFPIMFILPSLQVVELMCSRDSTLADIKRQVLEHRDGGRVRDPGSLQVLRMRHVQKRPSDVVDETAPNDGVSEYLNEAAVLESVSAIALDRMAGLLPTIRIDRVPLEEMDVDAATRHCITQLVGGKLSWKDSNTGVDAARAEIDSFREAIAKLRYVQRVEKSAAFDSDADSGRPASPIVPKIICSVSLPLGAAATNALLVRDGETADEFMRRIFDKYYKPVQAQEPKLHGKTHADFVLKVSGIAVYITGKRRVQSFAAIKQAHERGERPSLTVVARADAADLQEGGAAKVKESAAHYAELEEDGGHVLEARDIMSMKARSFDRMHLISVWDLRRPFRVRLFGLENLGQQGTMYWRTEKTKKVLANTSGVEYFIYVTVGLFHGGAPLCAEMRSRQVRLADAPRWSEWLEASLAMQHVPRAARICLTLWATSPTEKSDTALGWVNAPLFDFDNRLQTGMVCLSLWPEGPANPIGTCVPNLQPNVPAVLLQFDEYALPVVYPTRNGSESLPSETAGSVPRSFLEQIASKDPLYQMSAEEKRLLWKHRDEVAKSPKLLPKLLLSVPYHNRVAVQQMHRLLESTGKMEPDDALELLDSSFADPKVRAYAVRCVERYTDAELLAILLQLVQVLKYEGAHNSPLSRFLLRRAYDSREVGHAFFWYLKSEMHVQEISQRYGLMLEAYLKGCGQHRFQLVDQDRLINTLTAVANGIKVKKDAERLETERAELRKLDLPAGGVKLPLDPRMEAKSLRVEKCKYMDSKKLPLWLVFENIDTSGADHMIIFKSGDDLRQDMLTLQMIRLMDKLWRANGLDLRLSPYGCVATGDEIGMIEVVKNSETTANITRKRGGAKAAFKSDPLLKWLKTHNKGPNDWEKVVDNFTRSTAGYCVATYVLGIGDRHNDNVMCTRDGKLFHIDFGHFLGNTKSKFGIKRERAPFVLTPDFAYVMGGKDSDGFKTFVDLACKAYNILRAHSSLFINLFAMMLSTGIPELQSVEDLEYLRDAFAADLSEDEAAARFTDLIHQALSTKATQLNNLVHILAH